MKTKALASREFQNLLTYKALERDGTISTTIYPQKARNIDVNHENVFDRMTQYQDMFGRVYNIYMVCNVIVKIIWWYYL